MNQIYKMVRTLIGVEGKYSNNPNDAGGETMWGITHKVARENGYVGAMKDMPREVAEQLYLAIYFEKPNFNLVWGVSPQIAHELMDTGVNMGTGTATKFLQQSLNVLNKSHKDVPLYPELIVDGDLGRGTLSALMLFLKTRGAEGELVLMRMLNALQGARYIAITDGRVQNEEFIYGWFLNRVVV